MTDTAGLVLPRDGAVETPRRTNATIEVRDHELSVRGRLLAAEHQPDPRRPGYCANLRCGDRYPCLPRRLADRAESASRQGWPASWTVRVDMHSCGITTPRLPDGRDPWGQA